jgi:hypothetical protein
MERYKESVLMRSSTLALASPGVARNAFLDQTLQSGEMGFQE